MRWGGGENRGIGHTSEEIANDFRVTLDPTSCRSTVETVQDIRTLGASAPRVAPRSAAAVQAIRSRGSDSGAKTVARREHIACEWNSKKQLGEDLMRQTRFLTRGGEIRIIYIYFT